MNKDSKIFLKAPYLFAAVCFNTAIMLCTFLSGRRYGCWAGGVISWWRRSVWRQNRVPVTRFTSRRFSAPDTKRSRWDFGSFWLWDKSAGDKACQQPCSVLHLYDVVSTHESSSSMAQSTTQRHSPVTLYFPLRCHWQSPCQETHLAADWLQTMFDFLQPCTRWGNTVTMASLRLWRIPLKFQKVKLQSNLEMY